MAFLLHGRMLVSKHCQPRCRKILSLLDEKTVFCVWADRVTFLSYAKNTSMHLLTKADIGWCDVHGAIATALLNHKIPGARQKTVPTLLGSAQGWRVMTAMFVVVDTDV